MAAALLFIPLGLAGLALLVYIWMPRNPASTPSDQAMLHHTLGGMERGVQPHTRRPVRRPLRPLAEVGDQAVLASLTPAPDVITPATPLVAERADAPLAVEVDGDRAGAGALEVETQNGGGEVQVVFSDLLSDQDEAARGAWSVESAGESWVNAALDADEEGVAFGDLDDIFAEKTPVHSSSTKESQDPAPPAPETEHEGGVLYPSGPHHAVAPQVSTAAVAVPLRRRRSDRRVALAKFPFDPSVWDDPLSPARRRRLQKRAERATRRDEERASKAYRLIEQAEQRSRELAQQAEKAAEADTPVAAVDTGEFSDVWSRASHAEAPEKVGVEAAAPRASKRVAKKARDAQKRAAKAEAKLAKLMAKHEATQQKLAKKNEDASANSAPVELEVDLRGIGESAARTANLDGAADGPVAPTDVLPASEELRIELLDALPTGDMENSETPLSEREARRAQKRAEKESRRLEKLMERERRRDERQDDRVSKDDVLQVEFDDSPGLGSEAALVSDEEALLAQAAHSGTSTWEQYAGDETPLEESLEVSEWQEPSGTEDGLQGAAVSSWEAAASGITDFIDPTLGNHPTDAREWVDLGEEIEDTAEAGPGKGREAIHDEEDALPEELEGTVFDTIVEIGTKAERKRRFTRRRDEYEEDGVSISEWVADGATLVTVTSDTVDHHSYDLPEPIPDRVQIAFGAED